MKSKPIQADLISLTWLTLPDSTACPGPDRLRSTSRGRQHASGSMPLQIPGALYKYRIGKHGKILNFRAAPRTAADVSLKFIAYGDMGESIHKHAKSPGYVALSHPAGKLSPYRDLELDSCKWIQWEGEVL